MVFYNQRRIFKLEKFYWIIKFASIKTGLKYHHFNIFQCQLYISSHFITFCLVLVTKILLILFCCRTVYNLGIDILSIFFRVKFCYWWWIVAPIYVLVLGYVCQTLWMVNVGVKAKCCDTLVSKILFTDVWIYRFH